MGKIRKIILVLIFVLITSPANSQYNPIKESPLDVIDRLQKNQKVPQPSTEPIQENVIQNEDGIIFDPEKGIILPKNELSSPQEDITSDVSNIDDDVNEVVTIDYSKRYVDRQFEKHFRELIVYLKEVGKSYQRIFQTIANIFIVVFGDVSHWGIVKSPPPLFVSIPLILLVYVMTCYPLMKIAHTISNEEWMAWVFPYQLVLLLKITERPRWKLIVFLIPGINLIFLAIIFKEIFEIYHQPGWYGILMLFPGVNIALLWYLAYVEIN